MLSSAARKVDINTDLLLQVATPKTKTKYWSPNGSKSSPNGDKSLNLAALMLSKYPLGGEIFSIFNQIQWGSNLRIFE